MNREGPPKGEVSLKADAKGAKNVSRFQMCERYSTLSQDTKNFFCHKCDNSD